MSSSHAQDGEGLALIRHGSDKISRSQDQEDGENDRTTRSIGIGIISQREQKPHAWTN